MAQPARRGPKSSRRVYERARVKSRCQGWTGRRFVGAMLRVYVYSNWVLRCCTNNAMTHGIPSSDLNQMCGFSENLRVLVPRRTNQLSPIREFASLASHTPISNKFPNTENCSSSIVATWRIELRFSLHFTLQAGSPNRICVVSPVNRQRIKKNRVVFGTL